MLDGEMMGKMMICWVGGCDGMVLPPAACF